MYKVHEDTLIIIFKLKKFLIITIIIIMRQNAKFYSFICKSVSRVLSWIVIYLVHILLYASCHQIKEMTSSLSLLVSVLLQMGFTRLEISLFLRWALTSPFHPYKINTCVNFAVIFCCTFPKVTLAWRYQASLLYGARTFLVRILSNLLYATI